MIVLSRYQTDLLLSSRDQTEVNISLDLNRTETQLQLDNEGANLNGQRILNWSQIEEISAHERACYQVEDGEIKRILFFSEEFQRTYSLLPTEKGSPTMLLASFPMHRIRDLDPQEDARRKIKTIAPVTGRVLDTTTGLGYTAIHAAQTASEVVTIELDPVVLEVCKCNPWSQELFTNRRIVQKIGDSFEIVPTLPSGGFHRIYHDPPTFQLAGMLYSGEFYAQLHRVLARGGRLFHYVGDLNSPTMRSITVGVIKRLEAAGFKNVRKAPEAYGVTADR